jgi:hypothetical protein
MASAPLLSATIEADDDTSTPKLSGPTGNIGSSSSPASREQREPVRLVPGTQQSSGLEEGGIVGRWFDVPLLPSAYRPLGWHLEAIIASHILGTAVRVQVGRHSGLHPLWTLSVWPLTSSHID